MRETGLNQSLTYIPFSPHSQQIFFYFPLQISSQKEILAVHLHPLASHTLAYGYTYTNNDTVSLKVLPWHSHILVLQISTVNEISGILQ